MAACGGSLSPVSISAQGSLLGAVEGTSKRCAIDRLLQYGHAGETTLDRIGRIAGYEHERDTAAGQLLGHGIDLLAREIDVQHRTDKLVPVQGLQSVSDCSKWTDHTKPKICDQVPHHHGHEGLVLDQEDVPPFRERAVLRGRLEIEARVGVAALLCNRSIPNGHRHFKMQAVRSPIEFRCAAELPCACGDDL